MINELMILSKNMSCWWMKTRMLILIWPLGLIRVRSSGEITKFQSSSGWRGWCMCMFIHVWAVVKTQCLCQAPKKVVIIALWGGLSLHMGLYFWREKQICAKENLGERRKGSICGLGLLFEQVGIARDIADLASCMYATLYKTSDVDNGQL